MPGKGVFVSVSYTRQGHLLLLQKPLDTREIET